MKLKINKKLRDALPDLSEDEFKQLEENCIRDGKIIEAIVIWKGKDTIVDGHNRYRIAKKHKLPFTTVEQEFESVEQAVEWSQLWHMGRRNMPQNQVKYLRGKIYNAEKKDNGKRGAGKKPNQNDQAFSDTRYEVAKRFKVSPATIQRDAEFAKQVDELPEKKKTLVLAGNRPAALKETNKTAVLERLTQAPAHEDELREFAPSVHSAVDALRKQGYDISSKGGLYTLNRPEPKPKPKVNKGIKHAERWREGADLVWQRIEGIVYDSNFEEEMKSKEWEGVSKVAIRKMIQAHQALAESLPMILKQMVKYAKDHDINLNKV